MCSRFSLPLSYSLYYKVNIKVIYLAIVTEYLWDILDINDAGNLCTDNNKLCARGGAQFCCGNLDLKHKHFISARSKSEFNSW